MTKELNWYAVSYLDSREGALMCESYIAEDEGDALEQAMQDYYFGSTIDIEFEREATEQEIKDAKE